MAETRRFAGVGGRRQLRALNNLGVINPTVSNVSAVLSAATHGGKKIRSQELDVFDAYYEGRQYLGKSDWNMSTSTDGSYIPIRDRKPLLQFNFAKILASRLTSKLIGSRTFPTVKVEDDPDTSDFIRLMYRLSNLRAHLVMPIMRMVNTGSVLVRFSIVQGTYKIQHYLANHCYPEFDAAGELEAVKIQYVFDDEQDRDEHGKPIKKWYRLDLTKFTDILYDNPKYEKGGEPQFEVVAQAEHNLGFVQAEWMRTYEQQNSIDGLSLIEPVMGYIDELNYSLSQSADAVQFNQDPQLLLKGMDEDEMEELIRSASKAWNLGREGDASLLEAGMSGVEAGMELRDKMKLGVQDLTRIIMLDPEKMASHAQSGKSMEILHGPMVELVEELRPFLEKSLGKLTLKMMIATLAAEQLGVPSPITIPRGYRPKSLMLTFDWPNVFPQTVEDLQKKVSVASSVSSANLISRETMTRWLAKDFGIEDIEEEIAKINAQPILNPFSSF